MFLRKSEKTNKFWEDESPELSLTTNRLSNFFGAMGYLLIWLSSCLIISLAGRILNRYFVYLFFGIFIFVSLFSFIAQIQRRKKITIIQQLQEQAKFSVGAEIIGSATHVAGHPLLERNQQVVLAIHGNLLSFYSFEKEIPIDQISVSDIETVQTIVYDDDRIPHADQIDPAAQALQIKFNTRGSSWTCLFNRMRKIKPVDWYQVINEAKYQAKIQ